MRRSLPHLIPPLGKRMRVLFGFPDSASAPSRGGGKRKLFTKNLLEHRVFQCIYYSLLLLWGYFGEHRQ
jgi:hypothetical protein